LRLRGIEDDMDWKGVHFAEGDKVFTEFRKCLGSVKGEVVVYAVPIYPGIISTPPLSTTTYATKNPL
jgi:hypothetical protein